MTQTESNPIFIVGAPRSGTTLLSAMLSSHPRIAIAPETHFIAHDYRTQSHVDLSDDRVLARVWNHFVEGAWFEYLKIDARRVFEQIRGQQHRTFESIFSAVLNAYSVSVNKPRWGEKTPGHYLHVDTIYEWFPNARILTLIRDPRAVCASLTQVPWGNRYVTFHAKRWLDAVAMLKRFQNDSRMYAVRYEDLVRDPVDQLRQICDFLGEDYSQEMIGRENCTLSVGGDSWRSKHLTTAISTPLTTANIDRWRTTLSPLQIAKIEFMTRTQMTEFGYEPTSTRGRLPMLVQTRCEGFVSRIHLGLQRHYRLWTRKQTQADAA
jgi:hypothetical protein